MDVLEKKYNVNKKHVDKSILIVYVADGIDKWCDFEHIVTNAVRLQVRGYARLAHKAED